MPALTLDEVLDSATVALGKVTGAKFRLKDILVEEVSVVDRAANLRQWLIVKSSGALPKPLRKEELTTAQINDLPDAAFALVLPGGAQDEEGKTTPRELRVLPHHTMNVEDSEEHTSLDVPHLRNALARLEQTDLSEEQRSAARAHLEAHADAVLVDRGGDPERIDPQRGNRADTEPVESEEKAMKLSAEMKNGLLPMLTETLEKMISVVQLVKGAEEAEGEAGTDLPEELSSSLVAMGESLRAVMDKFPVGSAEKRDSDEIAKAMASMLGTEAADKLNIIGALIQLVAEAESPDMVMDIAQRAMGSMDTEEEMELSEEGVGKARELAKTLQGLLAKADGSEEEGGDTADSSTTEPSAEGGDVDEDSFVDVGDGGEVVAKMFAALAEGASEIAKAGRKISASRLNRLRLAFKTLDELLSELDPDRSTKKRVKEQTARSPNDGKGGDLGNLGSGPEEDVPGGADQSEVIADVMKRLDAAEAEAKALRDQVKKMRDQPDPPASRSHETPPPAGRSSTPARSNGKGPRKRRMVW